jgi:hypothetical protein
MDERDRVTGGDMTDELAWAAGVFEATGTASQDRGVTQLNIKQRLVDGHPADMLVRFHAAMAGRGKIGGPYRDNPVTHPRRRPFAMWYCTGREAGEVMQLLWPWLSPDKRDQWTALNGL